MKKIPCPVCEAQVEIEIDERGHPTLYDDDGMFHRCSRELGFNTDLWQFDEEGKLVQR